MDPRIHCPDCENADYGQFTRRDFVRTVGVAAAASSVPAVVGAGEKDKKQPKSETLTKKLYDSLTPEQKKVICFDWDHKDKRGLLRMHVANNWNITKPRVGSDFFTKDQQELIEAIFFGIYNPEWRDRIRKQIRDDMGGYGKGQSIAIFGEPGTGTFEFVMTGRHLTARADGDTVPHTAFGGPIFYGHAAQGFNEKPDHPGNVFWHQAVKANGLYEMLDGKQRKQALVETAPFEHAVQFEGPGGKFPGIPVSELTKDQKTHLREVLQTLIEPYRARDRKEVQHCLDEQGGLDACSIAFYQEGDIGSDGVWDIWRLEGPSFVWHWRGSPHVHVWVNVADDASVKIHT